jgi:hypothetical protein
MDPDLAAPGVPGLEVAEVGPMRVRRVADEEGEHQVPVGIHGRRRQVLGRRVLDDGGRGSGEEPRNLRVEVLDAEIGVARHHFQLAHSVSRRRHDVCRSALPSGR